MSQKMTPEDFFTRVKAIHGNRYDFSKVNYIDRLTKVCVICPIHGEFMITPKSLLRGNGCRKCATDLHAEKRKKDKQHFLGRARKVHGNKYDYSKVEYVDATTKVCIICPEHGEFWQTPNDHYRSGCELCAREARGKKRAEKAANTFKEKAIAVHGNKYDYSKVVYKTAKEKVCIICPEHGEFWQTPTHHLSGAGCPRCQGNYRLTNEEFITKAKEIHGDKYDYSKVEYKNMNTKICIICPEHGEFWQAPDIHLNGGGCPNCQGLRKDYKFNLLQEFEDEYSFRAFLANNDINILQVILRNVEPKYEPLKKDIERALANAESMNPIRALEEKYSSDNGDDEEPIDNEPTTREEPIQNTPDLDDDDAMSEFINTMSGNNEQEEKEEPTIEEITRNREEELKVINRIEHMLTPEDREYIMNKFLNDKRRDWMANREQNK